MLKLFLNIYFQSNNPPISISSSSAGFSSTFLGSSFLPAAAGTSFLAGADYPDDPDEAPPPQVKYLETSFPFKAAAKVSTIVLLTLIFIIYF